jgi:hypothetical protein
MPCLEVYCLDGITRTFELSEHGTIFERRFSPLLANVKFVEHYEEGTADQDADTEMEFDHAIEPVRD